MLLELTGPGLIWCNCQLNTNTNTFIICIAIAGIPQGWSRFGSSVYYISTSLKTWNDSKQHCMNLGGDLVIIDSEEEQVGGKNT